MIACKPHPPTALDQLHIPDNDVLLGVNTGYFPPWWTDSLQAELAVASGCSTFRTGLFHAVLEQWGYENKAKSLAYGQQLGLRQITGILGYPSPTAADSQYLCMNAPPTVFKGLYLPIWDNGNHRTPVNDQNLYALYVWKVVTSCKGLVGIYEVWNEPDGGFGGASKSETGNWWVAPPPPCQTGLKASIFTYIRMLRITYEVVKQVDPAALVAVGGIGWPAYLDAICRYTDQPETGQISSPEYPYTGGAYFDCMSFHAYPHLYALTRSDAGHTTWQRHSDAALAGLWQRKKQLELVLQSHGFDNIQFPTKNWICTEFNLPRVSVGQHFGDEKAQLHFVLKALATAPEHGVHQMHLFALADALALPSADPEFGYMGLYPALDTILPGKAQGHLLARGLQWYQQQMQGFSFDRQSTQDIHLPDYLDGAVFSNQRGQLAMVLWRKTSQDLMEDAKCQWFLPESMRKYQWQAASFYTLPAEPDTGYALTLTATPTIWKTLGRW